ncbi:hypothetical protein ABH935_001128 [Catenulispora sp. GAS73]
MVGLRELDGLLAVARLADDLHIRGGSEDSTDAGTQQVLVVGDQDAQGHGAAGASVGDGSGRRAWTR